MKGTERKRGRVGSRKGFGGRNPINVMDHSGMFVHGWHGSEICRTRKDLHNKHT